MYKTKRITLEEADRTIVLVGTMHVSQDSAAAVESIILEEKPDTVCIELDENRLKRTAPTKGKSGEKKHSGNVLIKLLGSYQKQIGKTMASEPGAEFLSAVKSAESVQSKIVFIDRDIRITLHRLWRELGFWGRVKFFVHLLGELLTSNKIQHEQIEKMLAEGEIENALGELSVKFPAIKKTLVDERDQYMAQKIRECAGKKIVAVVGAGHLVGIESNLTLKNNIVSPLSELS